VDLDSAYWWVLGLVGGDRVGFSSDVDGVSVEESDLGDCLPVFAGEEGLAFGEDGVDVYLLSSGDLNDYLPGLELDVYVPSGVAGLGAYLDFLAVYGDCLHRVDPCLCIQLMNSSLRAMSCCRSST